MTIVRSRLRPARVVIGALTLILAVLSPTASPAQARPGSTVASSATAPRFGRYQVHRYGKPATPPVRLGYFELLPRGDYRYYGNTGRMMGAGRYTFSSEKGVQWLSGPFQQFRWGGKFTREQGGKTHKIQLQATTVGTNCSPTTPGSR